MKDSSVSSSLILKGRHGSGNKGTFESGQYKSTVCSDVIEDRGSNSLIVTMEYNCSSLSPKE